MKMQKQYKKDLVAAAKIGIPKLEREIQLFVKEGDFENVRIWHNKLFHARDILEELDNENNNEAQ